MLKIYKYLIIIIIVIIFSLAFTGSHIVQSVDDLAYAVALGIDVGDKEDLKVTFQFTMPSPSGESGSGKSSPAVIDTVEANSIDSAISFMNAYVSKEINLSHCKVIVISEEVAKRGIAKEIFSLMNKVQIRPDNHVIISTCSAQKYIESVSPSLENLVAKFYEILPRSGEYTGYTVNGELGDFFTKIVCTTCEPCAILGNVVSNGTEESSSGSDSSESEMVSAKNGIENIGLAAFKEDKLVGTLTAEETLAHLLLTNQLKSCNISIPDPDDESKKIDLFLTSNHTAKIQVSILNGTPFVKSHLTVNAKLASVDSLSKETYPESSEQRLKKVEQSAEHYLKTLLSNYCYKTAKEFHSDIAGFGRHAIHNFKTSEEFDEYDWLNHYQDTFFETDAKVTIKSGFLLTGT
ncbi:MAG: Ger(x)C family spore germination protein [Clostridia bacterium]|nr:Ger(x)C family spore germination protein [Clostridia bacterium]